MFLWGRRGLRGAGARVVGFGNEELGTPAERTCRLQVSLPHCLSRQGHFVFRSRPHPRAIRMWVIRDGVRQGRKDGSFDIEVEDFSKP